MTEQSQNNPCPEPVTCSIAVELANLRGQVTGELKALTEVVKALKASNESAFARGEATMKDHDERIGAVEKKIWWVSGAVAAVTAIITAIVTNIESLFHGGKSG